MALGVLAVGFAAAATAPIAAQEEVRVVDHKTNGESQIKGAIESEGPEGIKIKVGKDTTLIPPMDIKYVQYRLGEVKSYEYSRWRATPMRCGSSSSGPPRR
jgi:hypothetical protein